MSTFEKLFVQIFDRKNWIVDQLTQQKDLYDQYLASTLLINGIRPPTWLLGNGFQVGSADLKELKKEDLISGLLFPPSRPNIPCIGDHNSHYNRPIVSMSNGHVSDALFTETCMSNRYLNVGEVSTLVPKCHFNDNELDPGCALKGVPELDNIITSPQDQMVTRMSNIHFQPDQSLARIQRSRSRQKALELRNSAKAKSKKRPRKENYTGRITRSRTCKEPNESMEPHNFSICTNEGGSRCTQSRSDTQEGKSLQDPNFVNGDDDPHNAPDNEERAHIYRSGKKDLEWIEANTEKHVSMGDMKLEPHVRKVTSQTTRLGVNCGEGFLEQDNSAKSLSYRVTRSMSASINNSSKLAKLFDGAEGDHVLKQSDSQLITAPHNDVGGIFQQEGFNPRILGSKLVSNVQVQAFSTDLEFNPVGGLEVGSAILLSDSGMLLEPKSLVFDETGNCLLKDTSTLLDKEKQEFSPEMTGISIKATESLSKLTTPSDLHEQCDLSGNEQLLENDCTIEAANIEHNRRDSSDYHEKEMAGIVLIEKPELDSNPISNISRSLSSPPLSSGRVTSKTYGGIMADESAESSKISKQGFTESLEKVTSSSNLQAKCSFSVGEQLLEKVQTVEILKNEEKLNPFPGNCKVYRLDDVATDKFELDLYSTSTIKPSNLSGGSSMKGAAENFEDLITNTYAQDSKSSWQEPVEELEEISISHDTHEKCGLPVEMEFPGRDPTMEVAIGDEYQGASTRKSSNISPSSPRNGTSEICESFIASTSQEGNKISKNSAGSSDHLSDWQISTGSPLASNLQGVSVNMPDVDINPREGGFIEKCTGEINMLPNKTLPEDSKHDIDGCDGCPGFNDGTGVSVLGEPEIYLGSQKGGSPSVISTYPTKVLSCKMKSAPNASQMHDRRPDSPYFLRGYTNHNVNIKCNQSCFANKAANLISIVNCASENSWPVYKRRKIDVQLSNLFTTSPRLVQVEPCKSTALVLDSHHLPLSDMEVANSNVTFGTGVEMSQSEKCHKPLSSKLQDLKGEQVMEDKDQDAKNLLGLEKIEIESSFNSSVNKETFDLRSCFEGNIDMADHDELVLHLKGQISSEGHQKFLSLEQALNIGSTEQICSREGTTKEKKQSIGKLFSCCSVESHDGVLDPIVADQNLPEFEGFSIGGCKESALPCNAGDGISWDKLNLPCSTSERISILEQLCRSTSRLTPLPSSKYTLHETPDIYKSLRNGTLERMDLRDTVLFSNDDIERLKASYNVMDVEVNHSNCYDHMSSSGIQFDLDTKNSSCTPPVRKLCQKITSSSSGHSSERQQSMNPELTCFRIDEDASTSEENEGKHEAFDPLQKDISLIEENSATKRGPLVDMTNTFNPLASISVTEKFHENHDRGSLDSVNTELSFHVTQMESKQKLRNGFGKDRRSKNKDKENQNSSIGVNGAEKTTELLHNRFSRSKLSEKATRRKGNPSILDKGYKHSNIVSNVSSFIPLVQQKHQSAAVYTGKRDIKVKALEAAEAAKRLEEKKENDRKMKKEAAKLERARLEQEKLRQLELQQKKKEEERKKKEADVAARKRLREEEERKEKERKRKCIEEARWQQKEQEKLRAEREEREHQRKAAGEREVKRKPLLEERNHQRAENRNEQADYREKVSNDIGTSNIPTCGAKEPESHEDFVTLKQSHDKVAMNLFKANENVVSITEASGAQSYEISPYKDSDDEEEEDDEIPNNKFVPSWARGKHLASVLPFTQQIDPCEIFTPARNCSITEFFCHK